MSDEMFKPSPHSRRPRTHGDGLWTQADLRFCGEDVVIEPEVMIFHPEQVQIGDWVYIGHRTILKGYYKNLLTIGAGSWIGQQCFFHSAGGIVIGRDVGIGPGVQIITSAHTEAGRDLPILHSPLAFLSVSIGDDADIGVGATILPGTTIGRGVQVGAGAVLKGSYPDFTVVAGVPGRVLRDR